MFKIDQRVYSLVIRMNNYKNYSKMLIYRNLFYISFKGIQTKKSFFNIQRDQNILMKPVNLEF